MENNQVDPSGGQLPSVQQQASSTGEQAASSGQLSGVALSAAQQAQAILASSSLTPAQMTQQFVEVKSRYLQGQGVRIGD